MGQIPKVTLKIVKFYSTRSASLCFYEAQQIKCYRSANISTGKFEVMSQIIDDMISHCLVHYLQNMVWEKQICFPFSVKSEFFRAVIWECVEDRGKS
jgi:hypothetical protein